MRPVLRLYEDILAGGAGPAPPLPAAARMLYVVHGRVRIGGRTLADGEVWHGEDEVAPHADEVGAAVWRWELVGDPGAPGEAGGEGVASRLKLAAALETLPAGPLLWRGDSVAFPPGGCALRHVHQGPGIRCLLAGGIRIDTHGRSTSYGPGGAWYESGPDPVFAQAAADRPSKFLRAMILPRALIGKSSIRYVDEADKDRPRTQTYQIFVDAPIAFTASPNVIATR
jgi:hypothetical protein